MTNYEKLKSLSREELIAWLSQNGSIDDSPWLHWFNSTCCANCECVKQMSPNEKFEYECSYCEVEHKCRYFPNKSSEPTDEDILNMWLDAEDGFTVESEY